MYVQYMERDVCQEEDQKRENILSDLIEGVDPIEVMRIFLAIERRVKAKDREKEVLEK